MTSALPPAGCDRGSAERLPGPGEHRISPEMLAKSNLANNGGALTAPRKYSPTHTCSFHPGVSESERPNGDRSWPTKGLRFVRVYRSGTENRRNRSGLDWGLSCSSVTRLQGPAPLLEPSVCLSGRRPEVKPGRL